MSMLHPYVSPWPHLGFGEQLLMWMSVLRGQIQSSGQCRRWKWAQGCLSREFWECCLEEGAGTWVCSEHITLALREGSGQWKAREGTLGA